MFLFSSKKIQENNFLSISNFSLFSRIMQSSGGAAAIPISSVIRKWTCKVFTNNTDVGWFARACVQALSQSFLGMRLKTWMFSTFHFTFMFSEFVCPANQRPKSTVKKNAHKPLRNLWIAKKICVPFLIIRKSCYFDFTINKPLASSGWMIYVSCAVHVISRYYEITDFSLS